MRFLISAACFVIVVAGLRGASAILVPLVLALFVAVVSLPLLNLFRRVGVPTALSILVVVLIDAAALAVFGWLVSLAALDIRAALPQYAARVAELQVSLSIWITDRLPGELADRLPAELWAFPGMGLDQITPAIGFVVRSATDIIATVFLVILIFVFMLAEASHVPRKLRVVMGSQMDEMGRSAKIVREIQHYLAIKTVISIATGLTIGIGTYLLGLDFPLLWGLLAFVLNYIPNVGSIIAAIPAVLVAILQIGPGVAMLTAALYIGVNALYGNFLEPIFVGRQLGISTLVIILSLVFWGWVWGPIGMFLAVPLTMAVKIGLENSDEFRWIAFLMTAERRQKPDEVAPPPPGVRERRVSPQSAG